MVSAFIIYVLGIFLTMTILTVINWSAFRDDLAGTADILKYIGLSITWPLVVWFIVNGAIIMIIEILIELIKRHRLIKLSKRVNSINETLDKEVNNL